MNNPAVGALRADTDTTSEPRPKAIPTYWNGWRFRSRLEARFAVFFDTLEIKFWYEPEGFQLSSGELYLPDFYLPDIRHYAEVKPERLTTTELLKCEELAHDSDRAVILLEGPPDFKLYNVIYPREGPDSDPILTDCLLDIDYHARKHYKARRLFSCLGDGFTKPEDFTPQYQSAVYRSRSERFGVFD